MDGTLYYQKPFRLKMLLVLLTKLALNPFHWKELRVIFYYRRLREKWDAMDAQADLEERQYEACAKKCGCKGKEVENIIKRWMQEEPLVHLKAYQDEQAAKLIGQLRSEGVLNAVYSDYPTADKLEALGISVDRQFCSADSQISCMKPNPKGILYILDAMGIQAEDALMIGDRMEKDGEAAKAAGVDWLILSAVKASRNTQYSKIIKGRL